MSSSPPVTAFDALGLCAELSAAVASAGYPSATEVQSAVIPPILGGLDLRVRADTGSGKTLAFGLPLLQQLLERPRQVSARGNPALVLVLVPTRELAIQIAEAMVGITRRLPTRLSVLAVHGGVSANPQMMALRGGVDILVATPGRLLELQRSNAVELSQLRTLVLDEADRLLSLGFSDELRAVLALLPRSRQTLLFSATFPEELQQLVAAQLHDPLQLDLPVVASALIEQHVYAVDPSRKLALLVHLLRESQLKPALIFVSAKRSADRLAQKLHRAGLSAAAFHGDLSQAQRQRALHELKASKLDAVIATDLAARGIDIDRLPLVVNFELPRSPNDYTHRIGRTGRAGRPGTALTLLGPDDEQHFRVIEKRIKQRLPRERVAGFEPSPAESSKA